MSKGQKVTKTGYKFESMEMSEKMLLIVLICISGAINAWQHYARRTLLRHDFSVYLDILCNLACTFLLTFKMYFTI